MTQFLKGRFSVPFMGDKTYRDNWDAIFGKKEDVTSEEASKEELPSDPAAEKEPFIPAGHRKLPGGGIRGPRQ